MWGSHRDRKSTRLNSSHVETSYAVFCLKKKTEFRPDYVFLDLSLPDISGYEVFRRLKSNELLANTRFFALSGHGPEENLRAQKAGFDAYFTKPVDIKEMEKLINETPPSTAA